VPSFDPAFLPKSLGPWVADIAERMQCPVDYVGVSALVMLGSLVGRKIAIRPQRRTDWIEVANVWACIVGRPGSMKSPAMTEALKPLNRIEALARKDNEQALKEFRKAEALHKMRTEAFAAKAKKDCLAGKDFVDPFDEDAPEHPRMARYLVNDCTYEALGLTMAHNPNGVLVYRDELISLLKPLDDERNAPARGFYLQAWSGTSGYAFDRIARGVVNIEAVCLSILGSTQPGRLAEYVQRSQGGGDDGLIQRFGLMAWPDQSVGFRNVDRFPDSAARQAAWATLERIQQLTPDSVGAVREEFDDIPFLHFDAAAQDLFDAWRADLELRLRGGDLSPALESHLSKFRKLVPSLALAAHLADEGHGPIAETALHRAIAIAGYAETHARRCYAAGQQVEVNTAKAIIKHIRKGDLRDGFTLRDIQQKGWSGLTDHDHVSAGLDLLVDLDWLAARDNRSSDGRGGRPKTTYLINPRALD
jgi:putative DNA primase/helicase